MTCLLTVNSQGQARTYSASIQSLRPLLEAFKIAEVSGSLVFSSSTCTTPSGSPAFLDFSVPTIRTTSPLEAARQTFAQIPNVLVTQGADGRIRIDQDGVSTDFLNLKIANIPWETGDSPTHYPIYNTGAALMRIWMAPEVRRFLQDRGMEMPAFLVIGPLSPSSPPRDAPHLSGAVSDVTVSQALDYVLKTFPGVWYYEDCPGTENRHRMIELGFFQVSNTPSGDVVQ
jgi:hypothetical protein